MPVNVAPIASSDGTLINSDKESKKNFSSGMNEGRKNVRHYSNSNIADGSTDARAAILAADADGPVVLPPGIYAISANTTLTNNISFEPGAKLKPASGVTVTLNGGYTAELGQKLFDISAGGTVAILNQSEISPDHFGAEADGSTNDFAALKASQIAANGAGATWKSVGDGRTYRIGSRIEFDDTYDDMTIDFTGDWIKAINTGWSQNDVVVMLNGAAAYTGTARDYAHWKLNVKEINIDGDYDFTGFLNDLETAYDADPTMSDGAVQTEVDTAQAANGTLFNGFGNYVDPSGTGSANPTFGLIADKITCRNLGKGGINISNPKGTKINSVQSSNCVIHGFLADLTIAADDIESGEIALILNKLSVDTCATAFDLSTSVGAYASAYDKNKYGTAIIGVIEATNILNRTKIAGPWNLSCEVFNSGPQHRVCRYPVFSFASGLDDRKADIKTLTSDTSDGGVNGTGIWNLGTVRLKRVKRYAVYAYGTNARINNLYVDSCPFPYRGNLTIDYFNYTNSDPTNVTYQCTSSANYPFYSEGVTRIGRFEGNNVSIGTVNASQTFATYAWYIDPSANGSYIKELSLTTDIADWAATTTVTAGELRSNGYRLYQSNSSRTTGASFDGTEQSNWTEVGRGDGRVARAAYINDNTSDDYTVSILSLTGNGYYEHHIQQYSGGVGPLKASVVMDSTDAGAKQWSDVFRLRSNPRTVSDTTKLALLKNMPLGAVVRTLGFATEGDGGGAEYVYRIASRPGSENLFQIYGAGAADWWQATSQGHAIHDMGTDGGITKVVTFTDGSGIYKTLVLDDDITLSFVAAKPGFYMMVIEQDGSGGHSVSYSTTNKGTAPSIDTTASAKTLIPLFYDGDTWFHV